MPAPFKMETKRSLVKLGREIVIQKRKEQGKQKGISQFWKGFWGKIKRHHADKNIPVKPLI